MARFTIGHKRAKGGARAGSGRPPDWLKEKCKGLVDKRDLIGWLSRVASGESEDTRIFFDNNNVVHHEKVAAAIKDRIHAAEILLERGWGKPYQDVNLSGSGGGDLVLKLVSYAGNNNTPPV